MVVLSNCSNVPITLYWLYSYTHTHTHRERERETDRQTDRQTNSPFLVYLDDSIHSSVLINDKRKLTLLELTKE